MSPYRRRRQRKPFAPIADLATHPEPHVAIEQLAPYWNVEMQTVRRWVRIGKLHGYRLGGRALRVKTADALAFEHEARTSFLPRGTIPSDTDVVHGAAIPKPAGIA